MKHKKEVLHGDKHEAKGQTLKNGHLQWAEGGGGAGKGYKSRTNILQCSEPKEENFKKKVMFSRQIFPQTDRYC